jgi:hypothetical protein
MSEPPPRPMTDSERILVRGLLDRRKGVAVRMTVLVAIADLLFFLRMAAGSTRSGMKATYAVCGAATLVLAWIVWYFGWGLPRRMQRDLAGGVVHRRTGVVTRIARARNAYGETVTSVTIGPEELLTRSDIFEDAREGQTMEVEYLPRSKVALLARAPAA